jgi:hypothetical protein
MRPIAAGLHAALLLARGRPDALLALGEPNDARSQARRSFWAMAFCLPALLCLRLIDQPPGAADRMALGRDLLGFVIGWLGYVLASHRVALRLGREAQWPRFVTLWNWCNLVQYLVLVLAALPGLFGLPEWVGQTAWLVAVGWALWLEWFATRVALALPGLAAAGLVALDLAIGFFVAGFTG